MEHHVLEYALHHVIWAGLRDRVPSPKWEAVAFDLLEANVTPQIKVVSLFSMFCED